METARQHQLQANIERILLSRDEIRDRTLALGEEIERDNPGADLTLLAILHGSILFAADLMRAMTLPVYLESFRVASYHGGTSSSGRVQMGESDSLRELAGKDVLVVDDILDTGNTLHAVTGFLENEIGAGSVRSCVLLDKQVPRAVEFDADYVGFKIEDAFVVGYGLDYQGKYRNLPFIGTLHPSAIDG